MQKWLKTIGGAFGLGLGWMFAGAFIGLMVFEGLVDPDGKIADVWIAVLGIPAFFGGVLFFTLLRAFELRRRFHEVALPRAAVWGALSGPLLMGLFLLGMVTGWLGDFEGNRIPWAGLAGLTALMIPAFAAAGSFSVWFARSVHSALES
jgi:hypothetical protein